MVTLKIKNFKIKREVEEVNIVKIYNLRSDLVRENFIWERFLTKFCTNPKSLSATYKLNL